MKIILLASCAPQVGKSTLAKQLINSLGRKETISDGFASVIKDISYSFYTSVQGIFNPTPEVSEYEFKQSKKEVKLSDIFSVSPRHVYCKISDVVTEMTYPEIWADAMIEKIKHYQNCGIKYLIIDDWRRYIESDKLIASGFDVTTIYINKEGIEPYKGTSETESYEGQINSEKCDLTITYTSGWSNSDELFNIVLNFVK